MPRALLAVLLMGLTIVGCSRSTLRPEERPEDRLVGSIGRGTFDERVEAFVVPPKGWELDPPKVSDEHTHLVWLSPTGDTAYGVIYAAIPGWAPVFLLPDRSVHERVLDAFIDAMASDQGEATLLSKTWDAENEQMFFEAEGGLYRIDAILQVRGHSAWSVYVGKLRERPVNEQEQAIGRRARDATRVGREAGQVEDLPPSTTRSS